MPDTEKKTLHQPMDKGVDVLCAAVLAWTVPGLGHLLVGCRRHALAVGMGVGFLWFGGLAIGGLAALDARPAPAGARAWFFAAAGAGPSVLAEYLGASMRSGDAPPRLALGREREVATLYLAAAGLLNAMAVADAMLRAAKRPIRGKANPSAVKESA